MYEYNKEKKVDVVLKRFWEPEPLWEALNRLFEDTPNVVEINVVRDEKDWHVMHVTCKSLETGITY